MNFFCLVDVANVSIVNSLLAHISEVRPGRRWEGDEYSQIAELTVAGWKI